MISTWADCKLYSCWMLHSCNWKAKGPLIAAQHLNFILKATPSCSSAPTDCSGLAIFWIVMQSRHPVLSINKRKHPPLLLNGFAFLHKVQICESISLAFLVRKKPLQKRKKNLGVIGIIDWSHTQLFPNAFPTSLFPDRFPAEQVPKLIGRQLECKAKELFTKLPEQSQRAQHRWVFKQQGSDAFPAEFSSPIKGTHFCNSAIVILTSC